MQAIRSRPAKVADKLVTKNFGTGTTGFASVEDPDTAVCVMPGTEIAFDNEPTSGTSLIFGSQWKAASKVAIFRQVNKEEMHTHHDTLEFVGGETKLLTGLNAGQTATVLQLPAAPKTEAEAQEQRRVEVVG